MIVPNPTLSSSTPVDGSTGIAVDANIVLTFSEAVDVESGNIVIKKSLDDSIVETIDVTGSKVTGTGTTTITINPTSVLTGLTGYYLNIAATAFDDAFSNSYAGITDATTLNFATIRTSYLTLEINQMLQVQLKQAMTLPLNGPTLLLSSPTTESLGSKGIKALFEPHIKASSCAFVMR